MPSTSQKSAETVGEILSKKIGLDRLEVEILLSNAMGVRREYILAHPEERVDFHTRDEFYKMIERRKKGEPVAYIIKRKEFFSIPLYVDERVFIPRPETEILVEEIKNLNLGKDSRILDLGTGSGAIAVAIAMNYPSFVVYASDISRDALQVANVNLKRFSLEERVFLICGDFLNPFKKNTFDLIISNPPYLSEEEYRKNPALCFEPEISLVAGKKGDEFIRRIISQGLEYVKKGGYIMVEMGYGQSEKIQELLKDKNFRIVKDYSGIERILVIKRCSSTE